MFLLEMRKLFGKLSFLKKKMGLVSRDQNRILRKHWILFEVTLKAVDTIGNYSK